MRDNPRPLTSVIVLLLACLVSVSFSLLTDGRRPRSPSSSSSQLHMMSIFGGTASKIPSSPKERNNQAVGAIRAAIAKPKNRDFPLIECEFPPLAALNKLGDGSMRSANQVDEANMAFCSKLAQAIGGFMGPKVWLVTSMTASMNLLQKVQKQSGGAVVHSFKNGLPKVSASDVCIVLTPCVQRDYENAKHLAKECKAVVLVNGFAKDPKSVPGSSTMAYFLKPLTYNSQVAGYLLRLYPNDWVTIDAATNQVIASYKDDQILVQETNTPDLREPGRLVQKSVDERAIRARRK